MLASQVRDMENENQRLKEAIAEMKKDAEGTETKQKACKHCKFYIQHYVKAGTCYVPTYCGHCVHGRTKKRKPEDVCQYFELGAYTWCC